MRIEWSEAEEEWAKKHGTAYQKREYAVDVRPLSQEEAKEATEARVRESEYRPKGEGIRMTGKCQQCGVDIPKGFIYCDVCREDRRKKTKERHNAKRRVKTAA